MLVSRLGVLLQRKGEAGEAMRVLHIRVARVRDAASGRHIGVALRGEGRITTLPGWPMVGPRRDTKAHCRVPHAKSKVHARARKISIKKYMFVKAIEQLTMVSIA